MCQPDKRSAVQIRTLPIKGDSGGDPRKGGLCPKTTSRGGRRAFHAVEMQRLPVHRRYCAISRNKERRWFFLLFFAALCHAESTNGLRYALQQVKQPTPAQCGSKGAVRRVAEAGIICPIRGDSVKVEHFLTQTQRNCESSPPGGIFYGSRFLSKPIVA